MNPLIQWARRWNIPAAAVTELTNTLTVPVNHGDYIPGSESDNQNQVRLTASKAGARLWRNNVGTAQTSTGSIVRFGLANDSKKMNEQIKSSDLIGIKPILINGQVFGQFTAREVKAAGWKYTGTARERAQLRFIELVNTMGGDASFSTGGY